MLDDEDPVDVDEELDEEDEEDEPEEEDDDELEEEDDELSERERERTGLFFAPFNSLSSRFLEEEPRLTFLFGNEELVDDGGRE